MFIPRAKYLVEFQAKQTLLGITNYWHSSYNYSRIKPPLANHRGRLKLMKQLHFSQNSQPLDRMGS